MAHHTEQIRTFCRSARGSDFSQHCPGGGAHYDALEQHAGDCIGCKGCETRCPFGVKIAERMQRAAALFGR